MNPFKQFLITAAVVIGASAIEHGATKLPPSAQWLKAPLIGVAALLVKNPFSKEQQQ